MIAATVATPVLAAATLEARGLEHRFAPGRGLERVSFAWSSPALVAVTGPNGSGKSTLLRILAGLLRPSAGEAALALGAQTTRRADRRRYVGYASPDLAFYDELTVAENLEFAAEALGLSDAGSRVTDALGRLGLAERANDRVAALSTGLEQRLRLAFAILSRPPVLLLDEPGSHLDDAGRAVRDAIVSEYRARALVVLATNDEREWRDADERFELRGRGLGRPA